MELTLSSRSTLPVDGTAGTLVGRAWVAGNPAGPSVVLVKEDGLYDLTPRFPTMSALLNSGSPTEAAQRAGRDAQRVCGLEACIANSPSDRRAADKPYLLAPADLQALKACGVTFVLSMLERVIEERAKGDPTAADDIRVAINAEIGGDLARVRPGSAEAERLKQALIQRGLWSQYLEVGIGPYAEVFTKSQPMSGVGTGADIGIHPDSVWNNPEPEVVLAVNASGTIVGATLGNDVNLRDFEGRSALLLGRAKDNNASCALGPFIRLFDDTFTLADLRSLVITVRVDGPDQFVLEDSSSMAMISRDVTDLASQTLSKNHQYPDGFMLFCGTMFAPIKDRDAPGQGFTHKVGDVVTIANPKLGALINRVRFSSDIAPWSFGAGALMTNLAKRGLWGEQA
ncbi:fumarylacetoacetate hydrolase family protein [Dongia deserti]|uniref:fumarylacetoacetate hydrolase family protein n=1 Tax=Dongia deserti TaxID=2268030 RepID=UPI000E64F59E|nr:fumarylacetoacetate hydrolase family protein [Dongia deserti]